MADFVNDEIIELAVAREVDANRFYLLLAAQVQDPHMKKVFEELAAEELEHKAKLEMEIIKSGKVVDTSRMALGLHDYQPDDLSPELDINYKEMLLIGMQKEEASFRLYVDLAGMASDHHSKELLFELAQEEVKHKLRFQFEFEQAYKGE